jgi:hypothetical protein
MGTPSAGSLEEMSDQHPPELPPTPGGDPVSPPESGWTPTPLSAAGRATYAGKTGPQQSATGLGSGKAEIGRYAPKRTLMPLVFALVAVLVAVGVVYSASRPDSNPAPSVSATPSQAPRPSASPRDGTPFIVGQSTASGVWKIANTRWTDQGLEVLIKLTLDSGDLTCYFNALPNDGQEAIRGDAANLTPSFPTGPITAGSTVTGWVFFPIERGTTLVFLRTTYQAQVSGIEVSG